MTRICQMIFAILVTCFGAGMALAQGPMQKQVNYAINTSHTVAMGNFLLPAGKYVIRQVMPENPNLFALYEGTEPVGTPIAIIRTIRVAYHSGDVPTRTEIVIEFDELRESQPVMRGWNIPGMDGWEITSVLVRNGHILSRVE